MYNVNIYIKNKTFITQRVIFRFLPNFRRLHIIYRKHFCTIITDIARINLTLPLQDLVDYSQ